MELYNRHPIGSIIYLLDIVNSQFICGNVVAISSSELSLMVDNEKITLIVTAYDEDFLWNRETDIVYIVFSTFEDMEMEWEYILSDADYMDYLLALIDATRDEQKLSKNYQKIIEKNL